MCGVQDSQILTILVDSQLVPRTTVFLCLLTKRLCHAVQTIGSHPGDVLLLTALLLQTDGDGDPGYEINVRDVGIQLRIVQCKFSKTKVHTMIRVTRIEHRRLHQCWSSRVQKKRKLAIDDPDATTSYLRNSNVRCVARCA